MKRGCCIALLLLVIVFAASAQTIRKGPYQILGGGTGGIEVLWQDTGSSIDTIRWGTDQLYSLGAEPVPAYGSDFQHRFVIPGLIPGTTCYYQVLISGSTFSGSFVAPPSGNARDLSFIVYGDTRTNTAVHNRLADSINNLRAARPELQSVLLNVGDLVIDGNLESAWTSEMFNRAYTGIQTMLANAPFISCIGNHEGTGTLYQKYFPYPFTGARYWSFDDGPLHVAVIDQYAPYGPGSAQLRWLEDDLAGSSKHWKIVMFHEPGWSAAGGHGNVAAVQQYLEPLFERYGVPVIFAGHNHYYARAAVPGSHGIIVQHVTTGGGGAPLHTPVPAQPYVVTSQSAYHYCTVTVAGDTSFQLNAIDINGNRIDKFTVRKKPVSFSCIVTPDTPVTGQAVTLDAVVAGAVDAPGGLVTFRDGSVTLAVVPLGSDGHAAYILTAPGSGQHQFSAVYSGDSIHASGLGLPPPTIFGKAATSVTLGVDQNPSYAGLPVTFTATVGVLPPGGGQPTGNVTFRDDASVIGEVTLSPEGVAVLVVPDLAIGVHPVSASYSGGPDYSGSTSEIVSDTVRLPDSTMVVVPLSAGWNMVSMPMEAEDMRNVVHFPDALSGAFAYQYRYTRVDTLRGGAGYWIKLNQPSIAILRGRPVKADTLVLPGGWNMIGSLAVPLPVGEISSIPDSITPGRIFQYATGGYVQSDTIRPGRGYWIKLKQEGTLLLTPRPAGPLPPAMNARTGEPLWQQSIRKP